MNRVLTKRIDETTLLEGVEYLSRVDSSLGKVVERFGPPPLWDREPGFPSLLKIILEQQVSLASAQATYDKLNAKVGTLTPESFLELNDVELKEAGFSRQKTRYGRILAKSIRDEALDILDSADIVNLIGEQIIKTVIESGRADQKAVIYIGGVPHLQIVKI